MIEAVWPAVDDETIYLRSSLVEVLPALKPAPVPCAVVPQNLEYADLLTTPHLIPAAVLIAFVKRRRGWQILLTQRTAHLKHHGGQISFPGGRLEPGEDVLQAAVRETHEEIGVSSEQIELVASLDQLITISAYSVVPIVGIIHPESNFLADPGEVAEVFEVPAGFLLDVKNVAHRALTVSQRERSVEVIQYKDKMIWGATAAMLAGFARRLAKSEINLLDRL